MSQDPYSSLKTNKILYFNLQDLKMEINYKGFIKITGGFGRGGRFENNEVVFPPIILEQ